MKSKLITTGKILVAIIGVIFLFIAIVGTGNYLQSQDLKLPGNIVMFLFPVAVFGYVRLLNKKINSLSPSEYGFSLKKFCSNFIIGFLAATLIMAISLLVAQLFGVKIEFSTLKEDWMLSTFKVSLALIIIGIWEEFFFRGFVFNTLVNSKYGFHLSAIISSLFFSIVHWSSFDMKTTSWLWYIGIVVIGYILVLIYTLTKSIWSVAVFHFFWNFWATILDSDSNPFGLFHVADYDTNSKFIDNIVVAVLSFVLLLLLVFTRKKIKQLYPTTTMYTFPGTKNLHSNI